MRYYMYAAAAAAKSLQSCPTLCDPIDGRPPGSPVPGILKPRTLEWVAISFSCSEAKKKKKIQPNSKTVFLPLWFRIFRILLYTLCFIN